MSSDVGKNEILQCRLAEGHTLTLKGNHERNQQYIVTRQVGAAEVGY